MAMIRITWSPAQSRRFLCNGSICNPGTPCGSGTHKGACGIDIGDTLIGMHLKDVAVPVRIQTKENRQRPRGMRKNQA